MADRQRHRIEMHQAVIRRGNDLLGLRSPQVEGLTRLLLPYDGLWSAVSEPVQLALDAEDAVWGQWREDGLRRHPGQVHGRHAR
ncbi:MAG: hypothetical protein ABSF27_07630 [Candidatus Dormibacteria bacterium]|jgi:hypothetical protein